MLYHVLEYSIIVSLDMFEVFFFFFQMFEDFLILHDDTMNWSFPPPNTESLFILHMYNCVVLPKIHYLGLGMQLDI